MAYHRFGDPSKEWCAMDTRQDSTRAAALAAVPAPRPARGNRPAWSVVFTLLGAALLSRQHSGRAIGPWVHEHAEDLQAHLGLGRAPCRVRPPYAVPCRRWMSPTLRPSSRSSAGPCRCRRPRCRGKSMPLMTTWGAQPYGAKVHLVSLVQHQTEIVCQHVRVRAKSNESTTGPVLLAGRA